MVQRAEPGFKITTKAYNDIVQAVNAAQSENDVSLEGRYKIEVGPQGFPAFPVLFQVVQSEWFVPKQLPGDYEEEATHETTWMMLGRDLSTLKENLPGGSALSGVYIINTANGQHGVTLNEKISGPLSDQSWWGEEGMAYTGWVDIGLSSWNDIYGAQWNVLSDASADVSGEISSWSTSYPVYVIGNGKDNGNWLSTWITDEGLRFELSSSVCIATKTNPGKLPDDSSSNPEKFDYPVQMHVGIIAGGGGGGSGDPTPPGCYEPDFENDVWLNPYYFAGGKLGSALDLSCKPSDCYGKTVILWKEQHQCKLMTLEAVSNLSGEVYENASIAMLFSIDESGKMTCDYRKMPVFDIWGAY